VWDRGKVTNLGALGGGGTRPTAINGRGEVIGESSGTAFVWEAGRMERLGKLDLSGYPLVCRGKQATSCAPSCPGPRCGLWGSVPKAIDDRGDVVGFTQTNVGAGRAFLWRNGKLVDLGTLGGRSSEALAVADDGTVVGTTDTRLVPWTAEQAPRPRPFVWHAGRMTELPVDYPSPSQATAITPSGSVILGSGGWPPHQALVWTKS
jgi:probable HAF family extracellular repeat protein